MLPVTPERTIRTTLDIFDPDRKSTLVGTAALHLAIAKLGGDSSTLPLKDVDGVASPHHIFEIETAVNPQDADQVTCSESHLRIVPSLGARSLGAIQFDIFDSTDNYDSVLPLRKLRDWPIFESNDIERLATTHEYRGLRFLDPAFIIWWKAAIGRESDEKTIALALKAMNDQNLNIRIPALIDAANQARNRQWLEPVER